MKGVDGDRVVGLSGVVTLPVFLLDGHHHRVELAARTTVLQRGRLRLDLEAGASEQTTQSALVRGTGLGLWLCRRVLEEVEATLALEPDTGDGGACFAITLQRADAAAVGDDDRALREDDGVAAR